MRKNATHVALVLVLALGAGVLALGAGALLWQSIQESTSPNPIRVTMHLWPGYAHSFCAQEKGCFKEEGINVELNLIEGIDEKVRASNHEDKFGGEE